MTKQKLRMILLFSLPLFFVGIAPAHAFEIAPVKMLVTADLATTQTVVLNVKNTTVTDSYFLLSVLGVQQDNSGLPVFARGISAAETWVYPETNRILVRAGETKSANFIIRVPTESAPGSYYLGVAAEQEMAKNSQNAINTRLVSLLTLQVSGLATESVAINTWKKSIENTDNKIWKFNLLFENTGSVEVPMQAAVVIRNFRGEEIFRKPFSAGNKLLAGSKRLLLVEIALEDRVTLPGLYQAQVLLRYGKTNQEISALTYVWYIPLWSKIALVALGAILSLLLIVRVKKKMA